MMKTIFAAAIAGSLFAAPTARAAPLVKIATVAAEETGAAWVCGLISAGTRHILMNRLLRLFPDDLEALVGAELTGEGEASLRNCAVLAGNHVAAVLLAALPPGN